jgi:hypothetical protein
MKFVTAALALCCASGLALARPVIIEETSRITSPEPNFWLYKAAIDGDDLAVIGLYNFIDDEGYSNTETTLYLYRRIGTGWQFVKRVGAGFDYGVDDMNGYYGVDMKNGVLAAALLPFHIFEKRNGEWVPATPGTFGGDSNGHDVWIDGGRILFGGLSWGGIVFERNGSGTWQGTAALRGDYSGLSDSARGGPVGFVGNWAAIQSDYNDEGLEYPAMTLWQQTGTAPSSWVQRERRVPAAGHTFGDVMMARNSYSNLEEMYIADYIQHGTPLYMRDSSDNWAEHQRLHSAGQFMARPFGSGETGELTTSERYRFRSVWDFDRNTSVAEVFQPNENGFYVHVATLVASDGSNVGEVRASGTRAVASGDNGLLYFELPETFTTPALIQDTFATGNGAGWTPVPGSVWTVAQSGDTRVYRQSSTVGDAGAVLDAADWTNQSIQADVTPTAFNGNDRWVGLATRRTDAANYYYVTLRSSGIIALKRMSNGQFANLASASLPVTLNRAYRIKLQSIGMRHEVYVDGARVLAASDDELTHGRAALLSFRAAADYDNVVVTPTGTTTIFAEDTGWYQPENSPWIHAGGSWHWTADSTGEDNLVFAQSSVAGDARAAVGPLLEYTLEPDQIVEARARLDTFGTGADPWFGVMARYRDTGNYIYLSLRKSNTVSMRKLVNGQITQLGTAVLNVTPGTWYRLRLDAVGNRLRAYVNGRLVLESTDPQPSSGRTGVLTYRTAADFDDYRAVRP